MLTLSPIQPEALSNDKLFPEFTPATTEQWMEQIRRELKGAPLEQLYWKESGDIEVKPFYRSEDVTSTVDLGSKGMPGWEIRQDFDEIDEATANQQALKALNEGANAIGLHIMPGTDLRKLLEGIQMQYINLHFVDPFNAYHLLDELEEIMEERGLKPIELNGSISLELMEGIEEEKNREEIPEYFREFKERLPNFRIINVPLKDELPAPEAVGLALAKMHEYIFILTKNGIDIREALLRVQFSAGVGTDYFLEIAKLRALRLLWPKVLAPYTDAVPPPFIHTETKTTNTADVNTNMIRNATQGMAAIIGGANSLSINVTEGGERLPFLQHVARNVQLVLEHEGKLDKVADPAAGSYYIETLTHQIAEKAWEHFKTVESEEGYFVKYCMFL